MENWHNCGKWVGCVWVVSREDRESKDKEADKCKECLGKSRPDRCSRGDFLSLEAKEEKPEEVGRKEK